MSDSRQAVHSPRFRHTGRARFFPEPQQSKTFLDLCFPRQRCPSLFGPTLLFGPTFTKPNDSGCFAYLQSAINWCREIGVRQVDPSELYHTGKMFAIHQAGGKQLTLMVSGGLEDYQLRPVFSLVSEGTFTGPGGLVHDHECRGIRVSLRNWRDTNSRRAFFALVNRLKEGVANGMLAASLNSLVETGIVDLAYVETARQRLLVPPESNENLRLRNDDILQELREHKIPVHTWSSTKGVNKFFAELRNGDIELVRESGQFIISQRVLFLRIRGTRDGVPHTLREVGQMVGPERTIRVRTTNGALIAEKVTAAIPGDWARLPEAQFTHLLGNEISRTVQEELSVDGQIGHWRVRRSSFAEGASRDYPGLQGRNVMIFVDLTLAPEDEKRLFQYGHVELAKTPDGTTAAFAFVPNKTALTYRNLYPYFLDVASAHLPSRLIRPM